MTSNKVINAYHPNRAVRRAVKYGHKLPAVWQQFLMEHPELRQYITTNAYA